MKTDRRKIRTKRLLRDALLELIGEKGMQRVTVSDLTEKAGVNRGTFYLHYKDVIDMYDQLKAEIYAGLTAILERIHPLEASKYAIRGEAYPTGIALLEYIKEHRDFFQAVLGPHGDPSFVQQVRAFIVDRLSNRVFPQYVPKDHAQLPLDYLIALMASANMGIITHWIETGMKLSTEELALLITRFVYDGPLSVSGIKPRS